MKKIAILTICFLILVSVLTRTEVCNVFAAEKFENTRGYKKDGNKWENYETYKVYDKSNRQFYTQILYPQAVTRLKDEIIDLEDDCRYPATGEVNWRVDTSCEKLEFRVRAFRKVKEKKVFGLYSSPFEVPQLTRQQVENEVIKWVKERYEGYEVSDYETPETGSWGPDWTNYNICKYESLDDIMKNLRVKLEEYFNVFFMFDGQTTVPEGLFLKNKIIWRKINENISKNINGCSDYCTGHFCCSF